MIGVALVAAILDCAAIRSASTPSPPVLDAPAPQTIVVGTPVRRGRSADRIVVGRAPQGLTPLVPMGNPENPIDLAEASTRP